MKLRRIFLTCVMVAVLITVLAISISAADYVVKRENLESLTVHDADREPWTRGDVEQIFDGNLGTPGSWLASNGWAGPSGSYVKVVFKEEVTINSFILYGWSNWNHFSITVYDANGQQSGRYEDNSYEVTDASPLDLEFSKIQAKEIIAKIESSKNWGYLAFTEFIITIEHEHEFIEEGDYITYPTCAKEGSVESFCWCGEMGEKIVSPSGQHRFADRIVYRNGFTEPGYRANVCITCDTQDKDISEELEPLFSTLGYSVREDGRNGVQFGFSPNYKSIERYNELSEEIADAVPLQFGTVSTSRNVLAEGNPLKVSEKKVVSVSDKLNVKDYSNLGYSTISCGISGFSSDYNDTQLILSAYVYDGFSIYYLGDATTQDVTSVSYNGLLGITPSDEDDTI